MSCNPSSVVWIDIDIELWVGSGLLQTLERRPHKVPKHILPLSLYTRALDAGRTRPEPLINEVERRVAGSNP